MAKDDLMTTPIDLRPALPSAQDRPQVQQSAEDKERAAEITKRFEQMLWAEMLSHAGLEEALTKSGGQAASAFSQFVIESIASDLAEQHPLGLDPLHQASSAYENFETAGDRR